MEETAGPLLADEELQPSHSGNGAASWRIALAALGMVALAITLAILITTFVNLAGKEKSSLGVPVDPKHGPNFQVVSGSGGTACIPISCFVSIEVRNDGNAGGALVAFQLQAVRPDKIGTKLAQCNGHVPYTPSGETVRATCSAQSDQLEDYFASDAGDGSSNVIPVIEIRNIAMKGTS